MGNKGVAFGEPLKPNLTLSRILEELPHLTYDESETRLDKPALEHM